MNEPPSESELEALAAVARGEAGALFSTDTRPVDADLYCGKCGYNVRALARNGLCPECGGLISAALRGNLLMYADAAWVGRLRVGITLLLWWLVACVMPWFAPMFGRLAWPWILSAAPVLIAAMYVVAAWFLTTAEPRESGEAPCGSVARTACRGLSILMAVVGVGLAGEVVFEPVRPGLAVVGSVACAGAAMAGLIVHLRNLAKRLPDCALPGLLMFGFCGTVACGVGVGGPAALEVILAAIPARPMHGGAFGGMMAMAICVGFTLFPLFVGLLAMALWRIRGGIARAAMLARVYAKYPDARVR